MSTLPSPIHDTHDPPWLVALRRDEPDAAAALESDRRKLTRLDTLLAGVTDSEQKAAIVRLAYNAGVDPNDPIFGFVVVALNLQRIVGTDHARSLEASKAVADEAHALLADVRNSSIMVDGTFEKMNQTLEDLPGKLERTIAAGLEAGRAGLAAQAREHATTALGEAAAALHESVHQELTTAHKHAASIRQAFEHTKTATKLLGADGHTALGWLALNRRILRFCIASVLAGLVLGIAAYGWAVNVTGVGLSEATRLDIARGRSYAQLYPALPHSAKEFIRTWLVQHR